MGDNGLQGVTRAYRVLQKNLFLGCILHKNKSGINVKFLKTMDLLLWKKANFAFFYNSLERRLFYLER